MSCAALASPSVASASLSAFTSPGTGFIVLAATAAHSGTVVLVATATPGPSHVTGSVEADFSKKGLPVKHSLDDDEQWVR